MEVKFWWPELPGQHLRVKHLPGLLDPHHSHPPDLLPPVIQHGDQLVLYCGAKRHWSGGHAGQCPCPQDSAS